MDRFNKKIKYRNRYIVIIDEITVEVIEDFLFYVSILLRDLIIFY